MLKIKFNFSAVTELNEAIDYYNYEIPGLGHKFKLEVKRNLLRIQKYPTIWPLVRGTIRRCTMDKFPYSILYSIEDSYIYILVIAHQHRKPTYWTNRN
jgi:hypothetical protein